MRSAGTWSLALLAAFVVLLVAAALAYPGGSWADPQATRFHWLWNYWCDLIRTEAWNGAPNGTAKVLAQAAFVALGASLAAYWRAAAPLVHDPRLARGLVACGTLSSLGVVAVALLPHDKLSHLHSLATLAAGGCGALATGLLLWSSVAGAGLARWRHVWAAALLLAAAVNIVTYVDVAFIDPREGPLVPLVQKCASLLLPVWMVSTLRAARRAAK